MTPVAGEEDRNLFSVQWYLGTLGVSRCLDKMHEGESNRETEVKKGQDMQSTRLSGGCDVAAICWHQTCPPGEF